MSCSFARQIGLDASGRQVAEDLVSAQKYPTVAGRIALVPFDPVIRNHDACARLDVRTAERGIRSSIGNDGDILVAVHLETISPIGIRISAA